MSPPFLIVAVPLAVAKFPRIQKSSVWLARSTVPFSCSVPFPFTWKLVSAASVTTPPSRKGFPSLSHRAP